MTTAILAPGPTAAADVRQPSTAATILAPLATVLLAVALRLPTRSETVGPIIGALAAGIVELIAQVALWLAMAWLIKRSFSLAVLHYSAHRRRAARLRVFESSAKLLIDLLGVALLLGALFGIVGIVLDQPIGDLLATSGLFAAIIGLATEGVHKDPAPIVLIDECNDSGVVYSLNFWVRDYPDQLPESRRVVITALRFLDLFEPAHREMILTLCLPPQSSR
jgi:small-conductance mechanosensitive channel